MSMIASEQGGGRGVSLKTNKDEQGCGGGGLLTAKLERTYSMDDPIGDIWSPTYFGVNLFLSGTYGMHFVSKE